MSTSSPSARPRRSLPLIRTATRSPSNSGRISRADRNMSSGSPSSLATKPNPSRCPLTVPVIRLSLRVRQYSPRRFSSTWPLRTIACRRSTSIDRMRCPFRSNAFRIGSALSGLPTSVRNSISSFWLGIGCLYGFLPDFFVLFFLDVERAF